MSSPTIPTGEEDPERRSVDFEEVEDAYLEGDRTFAPGTAAAALTHRTFRILYFGAFASNIGTWMQNVVLGALAYALTKNGVFVAVVIFAQLGPLLLLSPVGGVLADAYDRKKVLGILTVEQALGSVVLAFVVASPHPSKLALVAVTFVIGIGNALYAPVFSAVLPVLVPREDLPGAVSLNSVQMNASRVIGPVIGSFIYAKVGSPWVFGLNAVSYAMVIVALALVTLPDPPATGTQGLHKLLEGVAVARHDRVVRRCLVTIFVFSLLCLPFITEMPKIANDNFGIDPKSTAYGMLYASFGLGAVVGALSLGTVLASRSKPLLTRIGLVNFAILLTVFGALRAQSLAYPVIFLLGASYFAVITALSTILQTDLDDAVRGKVMALWIMGFGGTVPFGGLAGGTLMQHFSVTPVLIGGSVVALALVGYADLRRPPDQPMATLPPSAPRPGPQRG